MRTVILIAAAIAAPALALAQTTTPPAATPPASVPPAPNMSPPPEFITAAQAFGQCVGTKVRAVPATTTPQATATQALAGCATEQATLSSRFETWVSSPAFPAAERTAARAQYKAQMDGLEAQIASQVTEGRAQAAAPIPAPAPTPTPTPTPRR